MTWSELLKSINIHYNREMRSLFVEKGKSRFELIASAFADFSKLEVDGIFPECVIWSSLFLKEGDFLMFETEVDKVFCRLLASEMLVFALSSCNCWF